MRWRILTLLAAALAAGCSDYAGPNPSGCLYALARVGANHLPVPLDPTSALPLLVADTFNLVSDRSRSEQQVLRQITVIQDAPNGHTVRSQSEFYYRIENGTLMYDNCPIGALCVAELVYAPRVFRIVGDSLFEVTPVDANLPQHVYGLVRYW